MRTPWRQTLATVGSLALLVRAGEAQAVTQFWPEVDYYQQLSGRSRLFFQALAAVGSDSIGENAQLGINYDFSIKQRFSLDRLVGAQSLADDRQQWMQVRLGYRYSETIDPTQRAFQNRILVELTLRHTVWGLAGADRNGFDFRWTNGVYSTRYRNRLMVERPVKTGAYEWTPYGNVEGAYLLASDRWSYVKVEAGVQLPVRRHLTVELYGAWQNGWTGQPDQISALGLTLVTSF